MKKVTIEEITALSKQEAEKRASEEYDRKYECHLVPVYVVVKTDREGRISSYTHPSTVPMGSFLEEATISKAK
jgi:hypothetical protein